MAQTAEKFRQEEPAHGLRYRRFSESGPWAGRAGGEADGRVTPATAEAWAEAIVKYWEAGLLAGAIDPARPLYVHDPGAGQGQLAWLLTGALQERLASSFCRNLQPCYVVSVASRAEADFIAAHPYLAGQVESGWLDTAVWDAEKGGALRLRRREIVLERADNPVVAVCHGLFAGLTQDLLWFRYGQMLEGTVARTEDGTGLDYRWRAIAECEWLPPAWLPVLEHYRACLNSSPVLLPSGAMRYLDHLAALSGGRYLLLAADAGAWSEQQLRLGALAPPADPQSDGVPPVNYHALSAYQHGLGAQVWNRQLQEEGVVLHAAWRDDAMGTDGAGFSALVAGLERGHRQDGRQLAAIAAGLGEADQTLTLLRLSCHDPSVLQAGIGHLLEQAAALSEGDSRAWRAALARTWANYLPLGETDPFYHQVGRLALQLGHWGLAKEAFRLGLALYGEDAADLYLLAFCEAETGGTAEAVPLLDRALALEPGNGHCRELRDALAEQLARWRATPWFCPETASEGELRLEPLGAEHAASLLHQYRDPQIAVMARLPALDTLDEAVRWIGEQGDEPGRANYAVRHECWGFVGVVSVRCAGDCGYFHFWIGVDHQGEGYGRRAAALLFDQAAGNGIRHLFTSVYPDNRRSLAALDGLGFRPLPIEAMPPDDDLLFVHRFVGTEGGVGQADLPRKLQRLCRAIDSPIVVRYAR